MPDWLRTTFASDDHVSFSQLITRMAAALVLGCVIAAIYRATRGRSPGETLNLMATLVLLTILICMITMVVGDNVARAFSLAGALAIVRFRTVVEDTRDTAFVIFAVAVGMAVGAGYLVMPLVCIPFAGVAAHFFRPGDVRAVPTAIEHFLRVRTGVGSPAEAAVRELLGSHSSNPQLQATATARGGAAFDRTWTLSLRAGEDAERLVASLNALEGVQEVELRRA